MKKVQKYHFWLAFFFFIFGITFAMIIWTVKSAINTPVYEDRSFMTSYQDVDYNYNEMLNANSEFGKKYTTSLKINNQDRGLEISDILYGQRSLKKMSKNQNLLVVGENHLTLSIIDNSTKEIINDANITFQITRPIVDRDDILLDKFSFDGKIYSSSFKINKRGHWNIIAKVVVGNNRGYLYIKTKTPTKDN